MIPPLWEHQKKAVDLCLEQKRFGLFFEMGTGKTRTMVEVIKRIQGKVIIFAPPIVLQNWKDEIIKYWPEIVPAQILILTGTERQRCDQIANFEGKIIVTNYHSMLMVALKAWLNSIKPECLILDESHKCKSFKSKISKAVLNLSLGVKYRYLLTGTPVTNSLDDAFMQFQIMKQDVFRCRSITEFRNIYFKDRNSNNPHIKWPKWVATSRGLNEIPKLMGENSMSVRKSECLDLPDLVKQEVRFELSSDQKKAYNELKKDFISYIKNEKEEEKEVIATSAAVKLIRLQQVACGFFKPENEDPSEFRTNERIKALSEIIEQTPQDSKIIIWATFKKNYEQIRKLCESLKIDCVEVHGGVSLKNKGVNIERFKSDPKCRILIGNQKAAGIGINLIEASYMVYYSKNFSLEDDLQSEARNYRGGSEIHEKITRIDIVANKTCDELINKALKNKEDLLESILTIGDKI